MNIKVKKRGGSVEDFLFDKLVASISKAGVPIKNAVDLSSAVKEKITKNMNNNVIESVKIRDIVIETLAKDFPAESENFKTYKK